MTSHDIRIFGDPVLTSRADEITAFDDSLKHLVEDMLDTMDAAGGVGLAANQIGVLRRVFVFDGNPLTITASGLMARCIQHETDHLDGVLFLRRLTPERRKEAMAYIRQADWFNK